MLNSAALAREPGRARRVPPRHGIPDFPDAGFPGACEWATIEHIFQATQCYLSQDGTEEGKAAALADARRFIFGGDIVTGLDARKARKLWMLTRAQLRTRWAVEILHGVMASATGAKYSRRDSEDPRILLSTYPAELWHIVPRQTVAIRFTWLEAIRAALLVVGAKYFQRRKVVAHTQQSFPILPRASRFQYLHEHGPLSSLLYVDPAGSYFHRCPS